ncbi:MAG: hypothetical protein ACLTDF_09960 [Coprococcus sp.]
MNSLAATSFFSRRSMNDHPKPQINEADILRKSAVIHKLIRYNYKTLMVPYPLPPISR